MKIKASILSGVVATLFLSVGTERAGITEGFQIGDYAPEIILPEFGGRAIDFREHAGQYTLVNFWAAYDAESRVRNIQLRNSVKELDSSLLAVHSISMDERKSVFEGTLKADGLEKTNQWNDRRGKSSALYKMYGLEKGRDRKPCSKSKTHYKRQKGVVPPHQAGQLLSLFRHLARPQVARARSAEPSDKLLHQPFAKRRVRNGYQTAGTLA